MLEIATVPTSETFFVKDNEESEATVPIQLAATAEYLKDYMALKEIWEALDGPNWKYYGEAAPMGCNWNFDKEIDMWGYQPGVQLLDNGRVASIVISGFGANGIVPDAIGQLTELRILNLGARRTGGRTPVQGRNLQHDARATPENPHGLRAEVFVS